MITLNVNEKSIEDVRNAIVDLKAHYLTSQIMDVLDSFFCSTLHEIAEKFAGSDDGEFGTDKLYDCIHTTCKIMQLKE